MATDPTILRWIYLNKGIFEKKTVLELGSGPGLCGIVAAMHANAVVLSDYIPQLLNTMKENIKLNTPMPISNKNKIYTTLIDFNATDRVAVPEFLKDGVDIIIGSEVNYYPEVAKILANAINLYLKTDGVFYGISPTFRGQGNGVLVEEMTRLGFNVELKFPNSPEQVLDDAGEALTCFTCTRK
jgi:ribosomal protein L11 methylase PrmA